jgi:hypothetical protein
LSEKLRRLIRKAFRKRVIKSTYKPNGQTQPQNTLPKTTAPKMITPKTMANLA